MTSSAAGFRAPEVLSCGRHGKHAGPSYGLFPADRYFYSAAVVAVKTCIFPCSIRPHPEIIRFAFFQPGERPAVAADVFHPDILYALPKTLVRAVGNLIALGRLVLFPLQRNASGFSAFGIGQLLLRGKDGNRTLIALSLTGGPDRDLSGLLRLDLPAGRYGYNGGIYALPGHLSGRVA